MRPPTSDETCTWSASTVPEPITAPVDSSALRRASTYHAPAASATTTATTMMILVRCRFICRSFLGRGACHQRGWPSASSTSAGVPGGSCTFGSSSVTRTGRARVRWTSVVETHVGREERARADGGHGCGEGLAGPRVDADARRAADLQPLQRSRASPTRRPRCGHPGARRRPAHRPSTASPASTVATTTPSAGARSTARSR